MEQKRRQLAKIEDSTVPADFENTFAALERAGRPLADVRALFDLWSRSLRNDAFDAVELELLPKLAAFDSEVVQNLKLGKRVEDVYRTREDLKLSAEQRALLEATYRAFRIGGAQLPDSRRARLRQVNTRIAELYARFGQNLGAASKESSTFLGADDLAGLPASVRTAAASAAAARGRPGAWLVLNHYTAVRDFLTFSTRRDLRYQVWYASRNKGRSGSSHDNIAVVNELLALRQERAQLLGYSDFAQMTLEGSMMRTPGQALSWMDALGKPAGQQARRDIDLFRAAADREQARLKLPRFTLQPWDVLFYEEEIRHAKDGVDQAEVASYLDAASIREAMFWVAGRLFGLRFTLMPKAPVPNADFSVWSVSQEDGPRVGFLYIDAFSRPGKDPGAWTVTYRDQQHLDGVGLPVVAVSYNFARPAPGGRVPLTWFDAVGVFHEFGHSLQALLSNVTYPSLAGLNVAVDSMEMASQWFERYLATPEVLAQFTHHAKTGRSMPPELAARIESSRNLGEGIRTAEMLESALLDMRLHSGAPHPLGLEAMEQHLSEELHAPRQVLPAVPVAQNIALFGGDNYAAQFYSYLWSDELEADVLAAFFEGEGPFDRTVAERLRAQLLSRGATVDPMTAYVAFRGRAPVIRALLHKRGLGTH